GWVINGQPPDRRIVIVVAVRCARVTCRADDRLPLCVRLLEVLIVGGEVRSPEVLLAVSVDDGDNRRNIVVDRVKQGAKDSAGITARVHIGDLRIRSSST